MIGDRIKAVRESLGMKQKDFAEMLGMKPTTFNGYEMGSHEPKSDILIAIANKCNVTVDYLVGLSDSPQKEAPNIKKIPKPAQTDLRILSESEMSERLLTLFKDMGILNTKEDLSESDLEFFKALFLLVKAHFGSQSKNLK